MKIRLLSFSLLILFSACVQDRVEPLSNDMQQQLALLPPEADLLGYINLEQIKQSAISKMFMDSTGWRMFRADELEEFKAATGFDFQKDTKSIYFAAGLDGEKKGMNGLFIATGNFNPEKIIAFITSHDEGKKLVEESYQNDKIYRLSEEQVLFCFADQNTLVAGKEAAVKSWLDKRMQSVKPGISSEWLQRIEPLKYKNGAWVAMTMEKFRAFLEKETPMINKFQGIKNVKNGSFCIDFSDRLSFYGQGECTDPEKATLFRDALKGLLASAKLAVSEEREMVDIINKVEVESKNERVAVQFKMTADEIEKLVQKRKSYTKSS